MRPWGNMHMGLRQRLPAEGFLKNKIFYMNFKKFYKNDLFNIFSMTNPLKHQNILPYFKTAFHSKLSHPEV